ncbi:DUF5690 family protein [Rubritalea squalenifaciens]|nr:DUF5690 family protein [Rubritalea squalenifaciens]
MQNEFNVTRVGKWLGQQPTFVFVLYAMIAAFSAYASMYAFRKPFTATGYEGISAFTLFGVAFSYKPIAVISQLLGYMSSKFIGIKVASEATMKRRVPMVLCLILFAELMLLGFAIVPAPYNLIFLFLNGLPLGMIWSLLFGVLEGRKVTEFLALAMSVSIIFSSGIVKSVGVWTMEQWGIAEFWMPFVTGLLFVPLLLISLTMLYQVPPPSAEDIANRTERKPMNHVERRKFVRTYFFGVFCLVFGYLCLMAYRDLRDSFMDLILTDLGHEVDSSTFAGIEAKVGFIVFGGMILLWKVKNHRAAVYANLGLISLGAFVLGGATILLNYGMLGPKAFYLMNGIGLYIAFVPYQVMLLERLLASLHTVATASFLIALADSYGYLSTVSLYLSRDLISQFMGVEIQWLTMLIVASYVVMTVVPITCLMQILYFRPRLKA